MNPLRQADTARAARGPRAAAAAVLIALVCLQYAVAAGRQREAFCLRDASALVRAGELSNMNATDARDQLLHRFYPPGYDLTLAALFRAIGYRPGAFLELNALVLALLVLATYGIGRRLASREAGFVAAALVALSPFVTLAIRRPTRDFAVAGLIAVSMGLMVRGRDRLRMRDGAALGLAVGASMMVKWTAAAFLLVPVAIELVASLRSAENRPRAVRFWIAASIAALIACGPWYALSDVFREVSEQVRVDPVGDPYGTLLPGLIARYYTTWPGAALIAVALSVLAAGRSTRPAALLLVGWGVVPLLAFEALPHRERRHVLPGMAAGALALSLAVYRVPRPWVARAGAAALIGLAAWGFADRGLGRFLLVDATGCSLKRSPACLAYYPPACDAVDALAREARARDGAGGQAPPVVRAAITPGSETAACLYPETVQVCQLSTNDAASPAWRVATEADDPADVAVWIDIRDRAAPLDPPAEGLTLRTRIDADCEPAGTSLEIRLWTRGAR